MSDTTEENSKRYTFTDTNWHNLTDLFGKDVSVTLRNDGGDSISVYTTTDASEIPTDESLATKAANPLEIGGLSYELNVIAPNYIWCKAVEGKGKLLVRILGTVDPSEDISFVSKLLNDLVSEVTAHVTNKENPHDVDKVDVNLGNLPNAISTDPNSNSNTVLATTLLTHAIKKLIDDHKLDFNNPHQVTKEDLELDNVANFPLANDTEALSTTINNRLMSPYLTHLHFKYHETIPKNIRSQTVLKTKIIARPSNWNKLDCSVPVATVEKLSALSIRVNSSLQVAFADDGNTKISEVLTTNKTISVPANPANGFWYVAATLDSKGKFLDFSITNARPDEGMNKDGYSGDFFDVANNVMFDYQGNVIRKVYIAKLFVSNEQITSVINTPLGYEYIQPITSDQVLGGRELHISPFVGYCYTQAEIEYNHNWSSTEWNDQIGVKATPYYGDRMNYVVLQNGLMGFLACGKESGSSFGASFATITEPMRTRIIFTKKF